MQNRQEQPSKVSKFNLNFNDSNAETAATKFVIIVTILGIIFFIVLYLIIILKTDSHVIGHSQTTQTNSTQGIIDKMDRNSSDESLDLASAETLSSSVAKYPPRPFVNNFRGPTPSSFHPTKPKPTGVTYAQLQNYNIGSQQRSPHNIQDIIGFLMPTDKNNYLKPFLHSASHDPFYPYKPKDPSDINLLATANLRFAPPVWKEITGPTPNPPTMQSHESSKYEQQATKNTRALTLTLNVFPMANDPRKEHYYALSSNSMPNMASRKMQQPRKMIIHLNLYSNDMMNRGENDEDYEIERNLIERSMHGLQQVLSKNIRN